MNTEWLDKQVQERLSNLETGVARLEEQVKVIRDDVSSARTIAAENRKVTSEILGMFKWHRAMVKGGLLVIGFGLFLAGRLEWTNIGTFSDLFWNGK